MKVGMPWSLQMPVMKSLATLNAEKGWDKGNKWLYLENLSTTTIIVSILADLGKPSTKSSEITCQAPRGTGKG
jgi:hypothetical protein